MKQKEESETAETCKKLARENNKNEHVRIINLVAFVVVLGISHSCHKNHWF